MSSRKGSPGPFDGLERAQPGEPVFTLRAHDKLAPRLVKVWVWLKRRLIRKAFAEGEINKEKRDLELVQCREAEDIAFEMDEWQARDQAEPAPMSDEVEPEDKPAQNYSGIKKSEDELRAERMWQARKRFERQCQNAIAEITDAAADLEQYGFAIGRGLASEGIEKIRQACAAVAPKRGYSTADLDKEYP